MIETIMISNINFIYMSRSVTISDEAYRKLYEKRELVKEKTGHIFTFINT